MLPLRKGQACICCRQRKTRCDGQRPVCGQCSDNGKELDCEYSDGLNPTRTEVLQDRLNKLQTRIQELETEHAQQRLKITRSQPRNFLALSVQTSFQWWESDNPPSDIALSLLSILQQHHTQIGWGLNMDKFVRALSIPFGHDARPHQALVNAAYLWALRLSPAATSEAERAYLSRVNTYLQASQPGTNSLSHDLHLAQAGVLLGSYLFATGSGSLEIGYHINGALKLALSFIVNLEKCNQQSADVIEEQEFINVFWHAHNLDRMWAVTNGSPATIQIEGDTAVMIAMPWPSDLTNYRSEQIHAQRSSKTVAQFLAGREDQRYNTSSLALATKSATLCERSIRFASLPTSDNKVRELDLQIFAFVSSLATVDETSSASVKASIISVHAMAYLAFIRLHERNAPHGPGPFMRCVQASRCIAALLGYFTTESEIGYLDPLSMPSFVISAKVLMREVVLMRQGRPNQDASHETLTIEINNIMRSLSALKMVYPVIESHLAALAEMRASMQV